MIEITNALILQGTKFYNIQLCMLGNFHSFKFCCRLLTFFKINFKKNLSGKLSVCQMVWIQIRTDVVSVLIWVQTVCKGYEQMTKVAASKEGASALITGTQN